MDNSKALDIILDMQKAIEPYAKLDDGDEYGEYTNWLIECGNRWDMMTPPMRKAYAAELKRVFKNYRDNYVIDEVEEQAMPRTYRVLRLKGDY